MEADARARARANVYVYVSFSRRFHARFVVQAAWSTAMFRGMTFRLERGDTSHGDDDNDDDDYTTHELAAVLRTHGGALSPCANTASHIVLSKQGVEYEAALALALGEKRDVKIVTPLWVEDVRIVGQGEEEGNADLACRCRCVCVCVCVWMPQCLSAGQQLPAWPSPVLSVEHRPVPNRPAPDGMKQLSIAVSGYRGRDKAILERLAKALGACFTRELTMQETHLICAEPSGRRRTRAACS